jgi:hypothetical protein
MWNERDESDPFTAACGEAIRRATTDAAALEASRGQAGQALLTCPLFEHCERVSFANEQELDEEALLGRAFSASYAPREPTAAKALAEALSDLFKRHQRESMALLRYDTSVYLGQRRDMKADQASLRNP